MLVGLQDVEVFIISMENELLIQSKQKEIKSDSKTAQDKLIYETPKMKI